MKKQKVHGKAERTEVERCQSESRVCQDGGRQQEWVAEAQNVEDKINTVEKNIRLKAADHKIFTLV